MENSALLFLARFSIILSRINQRERGRSVGITNEGLTYKVFLQSGIHHYIRR